MASIKVIGAVSAAVLVATGAIVGMNVLAGGGDEKKFTGGVNGSKLARELPNANADPFQVIDDATEADRRATSNRELAEQAVADTRQPSYTAPPVIQMEGSSGDAADPMADALVDQEEKPKIEAEPVEEIKPVAAPKRDYKIPEGTAAAQATTGGAIDAALIFQRAMSQAAPSVAVQDFKDDKEGYGVPMISQRFGDSGGSDKGTSVGMPYSRLPEVTAPRASSGSAAPAAAAVAPSAPKAPIIELPSPSSNIEGDGNAPAQPLRTIDPNSASSYTEGALFNPIPEGNNWASLARSHDLDFDGRRPVRVAQNMIGIDNNARIYDTARNAQAFDSGSVLLPGDQRYATLMYGFNSDDAAQLPVFAQIHDYSNGSSAYLNGARVQGTLRLSDESAVMEFNKLILQDGRVVPISAMAISADQLRVGVFKNVNRHTLSRYSSLFVSGLIKGIGDVGQTIIENKYDDSNGTTIIVGDGATTDTTDDDKFSDADRAAIAMGAIKPIGDTMASAAKKGFNRKPTVSAPAGFGMSIVFLDGLSYSQVQ